MMNIIDYDTIHVDELMKRYRPGSSDWSWAEEFVDIIDHDWEKIYILLHKIKRSGFLTPVLLGNDGRIWDGHHRILVAHILSLDVPVEYADERGEYAKGLL
jgi:hypothetical protein